MYRIIQHKNVIISKCCFVICKSCFQTHYCKVILFSKPNTYCVYVSIHNMLSWLTIYDHTKYARWGPVYLADMKLLEMTAPQVYAEFMQGNFVMKRTKRRFNQVPADQATEWIMQNGIIGITRNAQSRDKLCVTWAEHSRISQDMRYLFNLEDEEEEATFTRSDSLPSQVKRDADDVKKLITQLTRLDVFRVNTALREEEDGDMDSISDDIPLLSLASKDSAPTDVVSDRLRAEEQRKLHVITNVKQRLIEKTVGFHDVLKKHRSKTFATLYKATVSTKHNVQKTVKADRKHLQ